MPLNLMPWLARQLGRPTGLGGRFVVRRLNKSNRPLAAGAVEALDPKPDEVVADIGFGGGVGLGLLLDRIGPAGRVHGVDISPTMVDRAARRYPRASRHLGSITALPLADASLDGAICLNIVYFVEEIETAFAELARVLRPSGRLVLGVGDPAMMAGLPFTRYGFRIRPIEDLTEALTAAGLPVTDHRRIGSTDHAFHLLVARRA